MPELNTPPTTTPTPMRSQYGELGLEHILLHERVSKRDEEEVEADHVEKTRHHPDLVDAGADAANELVLAQFIERPPARSEELVEVSGDLLLGRVEPEVEVVDDKEVDPVHAQPHMRLLVGTHEAVVAVVMHMIEAEAPCPDAGVEGLGIGGREEAATCLGRQHEVRSRLRIEKAPNPDFAQAPPVIRGGVVVSDSRVPGRLQGR